MKPANQNIKREQKKSLYLHKLTELVHQLSEEEASLRDVYISRVDLSADSGICYVFFSACAHPTESAESLFKKALDVLKLYKNSLRKAFAQGIRARYTPDLLFLFDEKQEKVMKINQLLDKVQQELPSEKEEPTSSDE